MIATIRSISSYVCWNRRSDPTGSGIAAALRPQRLAFACATRLEIVAPRRPGQHVELDDIGELREQERPLRRDAAGGDRRGDMGARSRSPAAPRDPRPAACVRDAPRSTSNANAARTAPDSAGAPRCSSIPYDSTMTGSATFTPEQLCCERTSGTIRGADERDPSRDRRHRAPLVRSHGERTIPCASRSETRGRRTVPGVTP